ncbi:MAG: NADH:ubiquinone reductase (Na(+)-transporting) subunit A [Muribaculaceae bacterium]|nr:NADH:ubiquinone reductase (Na(+)-transporting) subunit A [Muribaculaceae bacterium]
MKITIKKGLDLRLQGAVDKQHQPIDISVDRVAVSPDDFEGFVPKTDVRPGDKVLIGDVLMHDKRDIGLSLVSPLAGTVKEVNRGARRHIENIVIQADDYDSASQPRNQKDSQYYRTFEIPENASPRQLIDLLARSGLLAFIRRRPFADVPSTDVIPRDIFISAFDSAPLAVDRQWSEEEANVIQAGLELLAQITSGSVFLSLREGQHLPEFKDVTVVRVKGPHPAGLPGIQTANIAPVNAGDTVWTLSLDTAWRIGVLATKGIYEPSTLVAVCGSCVQEPFVAHTILGASVKELLQNRLNGDCGNVRVIAGNVLTGIKVEMDKGYLHFPYTQLTIIPEGDDRSEFMGWASLSPTKMSVNPSFPGALTHRRFRPDARVLGGKRAMIMSGQYDRYLPMDIYAEYLLKAIISRNIENMEKLGIYEVAPEDFALAECLDSSKQPLQRIVREGLDFLRNELG